MKARFNSKYTKLTVVTCYAPTEEADDADKENFYEQLQAIMEEIPAHDKVLVIGDNNARTGIDNLNQERTMGKEGLGTYPMNDNGERFADFCDLQDLVIGGSVFPHKKIHKVTWRHPNGIHENQIDHFAYTRKFRRCFTDVKSHEGCHCGF